MQKKSKKIISIGIVIVAVIILLLLIIFLKDMVNRQNKNKLALYENTPTTLIRTEPNAPKLSAGMIPIKWNGENFVITSKDDEEWYNAQPAYMMLNDGYYKSEIERGIEEEQLASNNVGVGVPDDPNICGTIFVWVPRFAYITNEEGEITEIGYIKEETTPGEGWEIPYTFIYEVADETKPDFSLSGVWIEKDVDTDWNNKMTQMNQEESIYGFLAHTKASRLTGEDRDIFRQYIENINNEMIESIIAPSNINRVILKIVDTRKLEPIKANISYNSVDKKIEIKVTYTANGISKILDDYGEEMALTEENGIILTDTGNEGLAKGTYKFTIIDNKGNKQELSRLVNIDSLFKVAYINGTDNMDNTATYTKTKETKTEDEKNLINQLYDKLYETDPDSNITYRKAIKDTNQNITVIESHPRTEEDEQLYIYKRYQPIEKITYYAEQGGKVSTKTCTYNSSTYRSWPQSYRLNSNGGVDIVYGSVWPYLPSTMYAPTITATPWTAATSTTSKIFYKYVYSSGNNYDVYEMLVKEKVDGYTQGDYVDTIIKNEDLVIENNRNDDTYWYEKGNIAPKYTLCKYDADLNLKSTYDVDTKTLTTEAIDISNKGRNKVKLTLTASGTAYKAYISNDKENWQEVTDITSGIPKELEVDGWDKLYIKTETNIVRIDSIDVAYYKE